MGRNYFEAFRGNIRPGQIGWKELNGLISVAYKTAPTPPATIINFPGREEQDDNVALEIVRQNPSPAIITDHPALTALKRHRTKQHIIRVAAWGLAAAALAVGVVAEAKNIVSDGQKITEARNNTAIETGQKYPASLDNNQNVVPRSESGFSYDSIKRLMMVADNLLFLPGEPGMLSFRDSQKTKGINIGPIEPIGFPQLSRKVKIGQEGVFWRRTPNSEDLPIRKGFPMLTFNQGENVSIIGTLQTRLPNGTIETWGLTEIPLDISPLSPDDPPPLQAPNRVGDALIESGWIPLYTQDKNGKIIDWAVEKESLSFLQQPNLTSNNPNSQPLAKK